MRFLLLVHSPRSRWDEVPAKGRDTEMDAHVALIEELDPRCALVDCSPLAPPEQAVTVRVLDGVTLAGDNPSGEEEVLAGYYVIECATVEEAVEVATLIPDAATGKVLVHPILDLDLDLDPDPVPTGPRQSVR